MKNISMPKISATFVTNGIVTLVLLLGLTSFMLTGCDEDDNAPENYAPVIFTLTNGTGNTMYARFMNEGAIRASPTGWVEMADGTSKSWTISFLSYSYSHGALAYVQLSKDGSTEDMGLRFQISPGEEITEVISDL